MTEKVKSTVQFSASVITIIAFIVSSTFAAAFNILQKPLAIPLWLLLFAAAMIAVMIISLNKKEHGVSNEYRKQIRILELENSNNSEKCALLEKKLQDQNQMDFANGVYYRSTDKECQQPFCPTCWDRDSNIITLSEKSEWDGYSNILWYSCAVCDSSFDRKAKTEPPSPEPSEIVVLSEDIPF